MFVLFDTETGERGRVDNAAGIAAAHGAGVRAAETLSRLGVECVITGQLGPKASQALQVAGIKVIVGEEGTVQQAVERLRAGDISPMDALPSGHGGPDRS
jgi:predicted Fe-Mo cluster-binding NifX family protein